MVPSAVLGRQRLSSETEFVLRPDTRMVEPKAKVLRSMMSEVWSSGASCGERCGDIEFKVEGGVERFMWGEKGQRQLGKVTVDELRSIVGAGAKGPSARTLTSNAFDALSEVRVHNDERAWSQLLWTW